MKPTQVKGGLHFTVKALQDSLIAFEFLIIDNANTSSEISNLRQIIQFFSILSCQTVSFNTKFVG